MAEKYGSPDQPHDAPAAEQNPEAAEDEESEFEEEERTRESRRGNAKLLTTIQIIACLVVLRRSHCVFPATGSIRRCMRGILRRSTIR